jgi:hypothetical protein
MEDILPEAVLVTLRDHYFAGVTHAELAYRFSAGDEDSLTGALGQVLTTTMSTRVSTETGDFGLRTEYFKLRGRGANAPERRLGADGIFTLDVEDRRTGRRRQKGLLFQAKHRWRHQDRKLVKQVNQMRACDPSAIVVDYSAEGYTAYDGGQVVEAEGRRRNLPEESGRRLAGVLGNEFVRCRIGIVGLRYDSQRELITLERNGNVREVYSTLEAVQHAVVTTVRSLDR